MIRYRRRGLVFGETWFDEPAGAPLPDILIVNQSNDRLSKGPFVVRTTLISDLTAEEDVLWQKVGKNTKYEIRRSRTQDDIICDAFLTPALEQTAPFLEFFQTFARKKGLSEIYPPFLSALVESGQLRLTRASRGRETLVWHSYVVACGTVRLLNSASQFRGLEGDLPAVIGRANRHLHWLDLMTFKQQGLANFDWGGLFADETTPDRKGINDFKRGFGGSPVERIDRVKPLSSRGQVYWLLRSVAVGGQKRWIARSAAKAGAKPVVDIKSRP